MINEEVLIEWMDETESIIREIAPYLDLDKLATLRFDTFPDRHKWTFHKQPSTPSGPTEYFVYCDRCGCESNEENLYQKCPTEEEIEKANDPLKKT